MTPAPRAWRQVVASVRGQERRGGGLRWLELELPGAFATPVAGQFVQLLLPAPSPVTLPRPMSVARAHREGRTLVLGFLYAAIGAGTRALAALAPGASVQVTGPLGHGFPLAEPGTPVLVAGGRGLAPLLMAAESLPRRRRAVLLAGARSRDGLAELPDAHERLAGRAVRIHAATDDGSAGLRGDVIALLEREATQLPAPLVVHACGPHPMLAAVALWARAHGARAHLAMESVMACGTGVCRGCPLPRSAGARARVLAEGAAAPALRGNPDWAMCCTDGPVFEAAELDWSRVE